MKGIQTHHKARFIFAGFMLIIGILAIIGSRSLEIGTLSRIKPGFFPTVFGILIVLLSILLILSQLVELRKESKTDTDEKEESDISIKNISAMTGVFILYVFLANVIGYVFASAVALAGSSYLLGLRRWGLVALVVITPLVTWILFEHFLGIRLPEGSLF